MATFTKRPTGWQVKIRKAGINKSATFPTKHQALAWAAKIESEIVSGKLGVAPDKPFSDLVDRYLEEVTPQKRGARAERFRLERMLGLGNERDGTKRQPDPLALVRLPNLGPEHIAAWRDRRLRVVSVASVLREWATLANLCSIAVKEWRLLQSNPCAGVRKPDQPAARTRRISKDEIDGILLAAGYVRSETPETQTARVGAAFLFAIETAMRAGEICGLTWEHVDLKRRVAHLPKTKNGHARDVPLSREAVRILEQLPVERKEGSTVFGLISANLDALFRKIKARMQIEDLHFHDSRREALTRLSKKLSVMELAKMSGHRDLRILLRVYYAPDPSEIADRLG